MDKKIFFIISALGLLIGSFLSAGNVLAVSTINSARVNGLNNITAEAGEIINATLNVTLTSPSEWRSTAYKFGGENWVCVDTRDHGPDTTSTETFRIPTPLQHGTRDISFEVYGNNDCTNDSGMTVLSANFLTSVTNVFSFGTGELWIFIILLVLIVAGAACGAFYISKRTIGKKTK